MIVGLVAFLAVALAPPAPADPVKNPNAFFVTVDCAGETVTVVVTGQAAHVLGSTSVGVGLSVTTVVSLLDGTVIFTDVASVGKSAQHVKDLTTCTATIFDALPDGTPVKVELEVEVLITPRGG